jgi:Tol biopolymer transport system component
MCVVVALLVGVSPIVADSAGAVSGDNGPIAFMSQRDGNWEIYVMDADGSNQTNLTNNSANDIAPAFSPDGRQIAFTSERVGDREIYVMDADGSNQIRITNNPARESAPGFSPDGMQIIFASDRDGNDEIYVMDADGGNQTRITNNPARDLASGFSPDGTKIAFFSNRDGNWEIYVMNADGFDQTNLTLHGSKDQNPVWSPDGTEIAFHSNRSTGWFQVYVMDADGGNQTRLTSSTTGGSLYPSWSPDGAMIAFLCGISGNEEIHVMDADGSNMTRLTDNPARDLMPDWGTVVATDVTAPTVEITTPADGAEYVLGSTVVVDHACSDEPDGSGLASCVGDLADGALLDTSAVGPGSFTVTGTDNAGNTSTVTHGYSVVWDFVGFFRSVDMAPVVNTVKARRVVPLKFSLGGDQGLDVFAEGYPLSRPMACDGSSVGDGFEETIAAGQNSLNYEADADQYVYVWKTNRAWSGTCRQLVVRLADGSEHVANFEFR